MLEISKQAECSISRGTSILAVTKDFFITSNGQNVTVFGADLNKVREISLRNDLVIQHIYTNFPKNELILYCPDNGCIVWIDVVNDVHKEISLSEKWLEGVTFSAAYHWRNDLVVFVDSMIVTNHDCEDYYGFNIPNAMWGRVSGDVLEGTNTKLAYLVHTICCNHVPYMYLRDGYIIEDRVEDPQVTIVIYHDHFTLDRPQFAYHEILYRHNLIAFVGDTQIEVFVPAGEVHDRTYQNTVLDTKEGYHFLRAVIVQGAHGLQLVTLSKNLKERNDSLLTVFRVYGVHQ